MPDPVSAPSWRKPVGVIGMLVFITLWVVMIASASSLIAALAWPLQALIYTVAGIIWIVPLGPLLRWTEMGKWRE